MHDLLFINFIRNMYIYICAHSLYYTDPKLDITCKVLQHARGVAMCSQRTSWSAFSSHIISVFHRKSHLISSVRIRYSLALSSFSSSVNIILYIYTYTYEVITLHSRYTMSQQRIIQRQNNIFKSEYGVVVLNIAYRYSKYHI